MNEMLTSPANWFQILYSVASPRATGICDGEFAGARVCGSGYTVRQIVAELQDSGSCTPRQRELSTRLCLRSWIDFTSERNFSTSSIRVSSGTALFYLDNL